MKLPRRLLLAVLSVSITAAAHAGLYARASALSIKPETWNSAGISASLDRNLGYAVAVGYRLTSLRVEGEFISSRNNLDSAAITGTSPGTSTTGDLTHNGVFANAYLDIFKFLMIEPYIGAGIGYLDVKADNISFSNGVHYNDSAAVIGYQALAGVNVALTDHIRIGAGMRYITSEKPSFNASGTPGPALADRYQATLFEVSTRYEF